MNRNEQNLSAAALHSYQKGVIFELFELFRDFEIHLSRKIIDVF